MASFFLLRWQENQFTICFYKLAAVWTGSFVNLLLAVLLSGLISAVIRLAGGYPSTRLIGAGWIILALLFSAYGAWNAFHPKIKKITIEIANLPDQWQNKTIVQLSDIHLGHFYTVDYLNNLVINVNALKPDLIFITGDLFDGMAAEIARFTYPLNQFKAEKGVYFITGNHESYIGLDRALTVLKNTGIRILENEVIDIEGLLVIGISYPGLEATAQIDGLEKLDQTTADKKPRILLFHTPTNIRPKDGDGLNRHFATYWVPDTTFTLAKKLGIDLQLSGHTHAGQIFPFGYLTKLIYKGFDYGLHRHGNLSIYTTSGVGTWGPPMRTGNSPEIVRITLR
jgi:predicted MPP superfamily phosphohydrolase